ncbi:MAG: hypothetical protein KatS3mg126_1487 [Lysobacteraceae bacterium]|nr:MAG: hypothetical protein KatS3mg126_1487 [Xanthomonadaceae bacterium]
MTNIRNLLAVLILALASTAALAAGKLDINRASAAELAATMQGVGQAKAEAIVAYRKAHGPFRSIDQLAEVKGIGLKTVERNRDRIEVGPSRPEPAPAPAG